MKKPIALIIMDGFGESKNTDGNAIVSSNTPNLDKIKNEYPNTLIQASGLDVGLPDGQMGNSEVGHTNIGAGRIVYQDLTRVSKAINDGDFFTNEVLLKAMENAKEHSLHLMGLLSNGGQPGHQLLLPNLYLFCNGVHKVPLITENEDTQSSMHHSRTYDGSLCL